YLLLLAWNEDFSTINETAVATTPDLAQTADTPADPAAQASDIPQPQQQAPAAATNNTPTAALITVSTPSQIVRIDPLGGDIVGLSLPRFPTSIDTPDDPFPLMYNDNRGVYVAQSGLVGANGPDAQS